MTLAPWIAIALMGWAGEPPSSWVERLASPDPAARAEAIDALEEAGMGSLPALRKAAAEGSGGADRTPDDLIRRIGARRLLRGTRVSLDGDDRSVADSIAALSRSSGFAIAPPRSADSRWRDRRVTVREPGPLGFFEALDRLGARAGFRLEASAFFAPPPTSGVRVGLAESDAPPAPSAYAGPYRLVLLGLNRHRRAAQVKPPAESKVVETFAARMELVAEPGILIQSNGPVRLQEVADDRGRDLRPLAMPDAVTNPYSTSWNLDRISSFTTAIPLKLPEERGRSIAKLRGYVPIVAVARLDELFSAPFAGIAGKTLSGGGVTMKVVGAGPGMAMDVTIRGEPPPEPIGFAAGPRQTTQATLKIAYNLVDHLRIEDGEGRPFQVHANPTAPPAADGMLTYHVQYFQNGTNDAPARVRYFGVAAVATEIPFDFRDLPIP